MIKNKRYNVSKKNLIHNIHLKLGYSSRFIEKFIDDIIVVVSNGLKNEKRLKIKNLGSFTVIKKQARIGRNPKTKKIHSISKRNSISFKASHLLVKNLNNEK
jgi:nucleoid DNA-binding protein|tara:strand:+ start:127 stop:432 length:306 start_codon:yes stop_codon:yes gene_type:complete